MPSSYISSKEQARHYFQQPQAGVPSALIEGACAWLGHELAAAPERWSFQLTEEHIAELDAALAACADIPTQALTADQFELSELAVAAAGWATLVHDGIGCVRVRGFPVQRWTQAEAERAYWGLGLYLGRPGAQNPEGELLGHVKDYGERADRPEVRLYRTSANILYHCDAADMVGLLCLKPARSGGASRLVSSVALFNAVFEREPELIPALFEPMLIDARGEGQNAWNALVPCAWSGERLHTFFHSDYFRSMSRHSRAPAHSAAQQRLLHLYESIGNEPGFYLDMEFAAGDMQLVSNHSVLHARTAYTDWGEPAQRRHLLRLWLTVS